MERIEKYWSISIHSMWESCEFWNDEQMMWNSSIFHKQWRRFGKRKYLSLLLMLWWNLKTKIYNSQKNNRRIEHLRIENLTECQLSFNILVIDWMSSTKVIIGQRRLLYRWLFSFFLIISHLSPRKKKFYKPHHLSELCENIKNDERHN